MNAFDELICCVEHLAKRSRGVRIEPEVWANFHQNKSNRQATVANIPPSPASAEELIERIRSCNACRLRQHCKQTIPGEGAGQIKLFFVGEMPGLEDERTGKPFSGAPGELLAKMISAMQFSRSEVYLTTLVKCRPPEGGYPEDAEVQNCIAHLKEEIRIFKPLAIVLLGEYPLRYLLNGQNLTDYRQKWFSYCDVPLTATYSPGYLMRNASDKGKAWSDLQMVMKAFGKSPAK